VKCLEARLELLELGLSLFPGGGIPAGQDRGNDDEMTGIEVGRGELAPHLGAPKIRPALEFQILDQVGAVADGVDVSPSADVIRADLGLLEQVCGVRNLAQVERLVETVVGVEPAD